VVSRLTWLLVATGVLAGLAGLNLLAFRYFWYWRIWWFDLLMHGLGGVVIAIIVSLIRPDRVSSANRPFRLVWLPVLAALLVSFGWELFEFSLDQTVRLHVDIKTFTAWQLGWWDTVGDVAAALTGAFLGAGLYQRLSARPGITANQSLHDLA
jgi:glycopeptide antibiotics resistance protein